MGKHIFAVGKIDQGGHTIVVSPTRQQACSDAYATGTIDARNGFESRPLYHFSDLLRVESYLCGYADAKGGSR